MSIWNSAFPVPTSPFFRQIALLSSSKMACMDEKFLCSIMPTYYVPVLKLQAAVNMSHPEFFGLTHVFKITSELPFTFAA